MERNHRGWLVALFQHSRRDGRIPVYLHLPRALDDHAGNLGNRRRIVIFVERYMQYATAMNRIETANRTWKPE